MRELSVLVAAAAFVVSCGSQGDAAPGEAPASVAPGAVTADEAACDDQAAEAQCVCPDDYLGEPPRPRAATDEPGDCGDCPADCECKGGDRPCRRKAAAAADAPAR